MVKQELARDVVALGQVFTPPEIVASMLALRQRHGNVLEPSAGDGAFSCQLPACVAIEYDRRQAPPGATVMDFFAYSGDHLFDSIIGNPPYVRYQDIPADTRRLLEKQSSVLNKRANLYIYFIEKCLKHLLPGGELIFITPRDFLKSTSATRLNRLLHSSGTMTHVIELGDARVFNDALPNCLIWRFERDNFSRKTAFSELLPMELPALTARQLPSSAPKKGFPAVTPQGFPSVTRKTGKRHLANDLGCLQWSSRRFMEVAGHLVFAEGEYPLSLSDIAFVKVGAVSGADTIYANPAIANRDFVCSSTERTGKSRRMLWCAPGEGNHGVEPPPALRQHKAGLLSRRIRPFGEANWWEWGRGYHLSKQARIYVNGRTRRAQPFYVHPCIHYDGAVLAIFPRDPSLSVSELCTALNAVDWGQLGFVCDGRFIFSQRSLENAPLPASFRRFLPADFESASAPR